MNLINVQFLSLKGFLLPLHVASGEFGPPVNRGAKMASIITQVLCFKSDSFSLFRDPLSGLGQHPLGSSCMAIG